MSAKEAQARIKINKLLEAAGWRFFAQDNLPSNIRLEATATLTSQELDALGENFEASSKGFIDFLLLNEKGFPFIVLEAKAENKSPLVGKEQARRYPDAPDQIREVLIHQNYMSQRDIEVCAAYDVSSLKAHESFARIDALHQCLQQQYANA